MENGKTISVSRKFLAEIDKQNLAKDSQQNVIYATHYIKKNINKDEFLIALATEIDVLEILVRFTKQIKFNDHDMSIYLEDIDDVRGDMKALLRNPGKHFRKMKERLLKGDLLEWHQLDINQHSEQQIDNMNKESLNLFLQIWDNRFHQDEQLEMFRFFSMREFQRAVIDIRTAEEFGEKYSEKLVDFYCEKKTFTAKYEEAKGLTFTAPPFGDRDEFNRQCIRLKRYIFQNYKGLNPDTKKVWQTKDVLLNILSQKDPAIREWLHRDAPLKRVILSALVQVTTSSDIERIFSVFTLFDNKLNQVTNPEKVEEIMVIMKETPSSNNFDDKSPLILWRKMRDSRKMVFHPITIDKLEPADSKYWVKPVALIHQTTMKKRQIFEENLAMFSDGSEGNNTLIDYEYDTDYDGNILSLFL